MRVASTGLSSRRARVLGILVVVLILLIVVAAVVNAKVVRPARTRKHIAELEAENERLDSLLNKQLQQDRKDTHA